MWTVLCAVLIIALAYWVTKLIASGKWSGFGGRGKRAENMEILSQLTLGRDQRVVLVRCGGRCLLLGVTAGHVETLLELSPEETEQFMTQAAPTEPAQGEQVDFSQILGLARRLRRERR
jgi:flagellar biosynthetic protein FliO